MIIWAVLALLITAAPIFAWRWHRPRRRRRSAGADAVRSRARQGLRARGDRARRMTRSSQHRVGPPGADQTMQIALGGRKK